MTNFNLTGEGEMGINRIAKCISFFSMVLMIGTIMAGPLTVDNLKCEYKTNPIGIDVLNPRLSWQLQSDQRGTMQSAYEIRATLSLKDLEAGNNLHWQIEKTSSDQSLHVVYSGPALSSAQRIYWQVRVWDNHNKQSQWSEPAYWEMGLLQPSDWQAKWIHADLKEDLKKSTPSPMLRHVFPVKEGIKSARAYITALGLYEAYLNGKRIGEQVFTPGWTAYDKRLQYQTYDITDLLIEGDNVVGALLGDGWFRGNLAWEGNRNIYGEKRALLLQIKITYEDGSEQLVVSDKNWQAAIGPVLESDIYNGEVYDARLEKSGWLTAGFDAGDWQKVKELDHSKSILVAPAGPPVLKIEKIKPVAIFKTPAGETVVDMGQNMVGWIRLKVTGAAAGTMVTLRHAEVLDKAGNFYTENLRAAKQTLKYILKGGGEEIYEPHFTFQGFRYVAVEGYPGTLSPESLSGIVIHSDIKPTGSFSCSNPMINQLQHNIQWGQKGNFLDVPTDCPQRDERLGWTGDAQAFARTACFNADVAAFYTKWLRDVAADQKTDGSVPHVVPNVLSHGRETGASASAGWADAAVVIPYDVYLSYGDTRILKEQYASMKAWVEYMRKKAGDDYIWSEDFTFGDWLAFNTTRSDYPGATTDKDLIATAYFARSTAILQKTATILGNIDDAVDYLNLLNSIKTTFKKEFITANGRLASNTQTAYSLALAFDLIPEDLKKSAAQRLADDVNRFGHITTGFLGTPLICHVLSDNGYFDEAFRLLNRTEYPSWLYPVTRGATTIWERWDGIRPDSTFQDKGMNSFNHYAYGAIGEWLYRVVAGIEIDPAYPGYKHICIQPHPGGGLTEVKAKLECMYGMISSSWTLNNNKFKLILEIPVNTTTTIVLPGVNLDELEEGGKKVGKVETALTAVQVGSDVRLEAGSGKYQFTCTMHK
jgi:alpha-L-rhamnosidase